MRSNGTLRYEVRTDAAVNEYGEPAPAATVWSRPIPCAISVNNDTRRGTYEDGEFRQASYTVLVEMPDFPHRRIMLTRGEQRLGEYAIPGTLPEDVLGEFRVLEARPVHSFAKTMLTV